MDLEKELCFILEEMAEEKARSNREKLLQDKAINELSNSMRHNEKKLFRLEQQLRKLISFRDCDDNEIDHKQIRVSVKLTNN